MKAVKQIFFTASLVLGLLQSAQAILPIEKLDSVKGVKAYLVQTKALPIVDIEVSIDAGSRYDPIAKSGLSSMAAELMSFGVKSSQGKWRACHYAHSKFK